MLGIFLTNANPHWPKTSFCMSASPTKGLCGAQWARIPRYRSRTNIYNITTLGFYFKETWVLTDLKGTTMRCTTRWQLPVFVLIFGLLHFPPPPPLPSPSPGVKGGPWHHRYTQLYTNSFGSVVLEVNESSQNLTEYFSYLLVLYKKKSFHKFEENKC